MPSSRLIPIEDQEMPTCQTCGKGIERKRYRLQLENRKSYLKRKYCGRQCMGQAYEIDAPRWRKRKMGNGA